MEFTTRFELQSQATRLVENGPYAWGVGARTGLSPSLMLFSKRLRPRPQLVTPLQTTIRTRKSDLQRELFPLHSPLLGESWLVSFPPLSYMLKFSGSSCLIGGPNESWKRPRTANRNYDATYNTSGKNKSVSDCGSRDTTSPAAGRRSDHDHDDDAPCRQQSCSSS